MTPLLTIIAAFTLATVPSEVWQREVVSIYGQLDRQAPTWDPELDLATSLLLQNHDALRPRQALRKLGRYEGLLLPVLVVAHQNEEIREALRRYIRDFVLPQQITHFYVKQNDDRLAFLFVRRLLNNLRITKKTAHTVTLEGELVSGRGGVRAYVAKPDERVVAFTPRQFGQHLRLEVPLDAGKGSYQIELVAHGPRGREVIALMPLHHGRRGTDGEYPHGGYAAQGEHTTWETPEQLLTCLNRDRSRLGIRPVSWDSTLSVTAAAHARAMAEARIAAHVLPFGTHPSERLERAGIHTSRFYENVAMVRTLAQAHAELWQSPSHRMALLDPKINRIGVGVQAINTDGGQVLFVVEHLAQR